MLGNDVVDLGDAEARARAIHPRFDRRVFDAEEQAWLRARRRPERDRWVLWAAKESAYKAVRRLDEAVVFSPVRFAVRLRTEARGFRGWVRHDERRLRVDVEVERRFVHAVSRLDPWIGAEPLGEVRVMPGEEAMEASAASALVRAMARRSVAAALDLAPAALRFERSGRLPLLRAAGRLVPALSLSHHGRCAAFVAALP